MSCREDTFIEYEMLFDRFQEDNGRSPSSEEACGLWVKAEAGAEEKRQARLDVMKGD